MTRPRTAQQSIRRRTTAPTPSRKPSGGDLRDLTRMLGACNDIVVVLDDDGVVRDLSMADQTLAEEATLAWLNRPMTDIVTVESQAKIRVMLDSSETRAVRQEINHVLGDAELPVRYTAIRLAPGGPVAAVGRDLRDVAHLQQQLVEANLSAERNYALHRAAEDQSRVLFQNAVDAIVVVDAENGRIVELNPAAEDLLRRTARGLVGTAFDTLFADASVGLVRDGFATARAVGHAAWQQLALQGDAQVAGVAWLIRGGPETHILIRLIPKPALPVAAEMPKTNFGANWDALRRLPAALVATDAAFRITDANERFLDLAGLSVVDETRGESLAHLLQLGVAELQGAATMPLDGDAAPTLAGTLRRADGGATDVMVSGASSERPGAEAFCFLLSPSISPPAHDRRPPLQAADEMTGLVGRMPLRDIVRESADIIEELCIGAALEMTGDNRASAAEMLGLSRQSLYSKLRRYGIGDLPEEPGRNGAAGRIDDVSR